MANRTKRTPPPFGANQEDFEDHSVMSGLGFWLIAFLLFVALATAAVIVGTSKIEADITARATAALEQSGYVAVVAEASGTDVELYGSYSTDQSEEAAHLVVQRVAGVTGVSGELWFISDDELEEIIITGDAIEFAWDGTSVVITGDISTQDRKMFISDTLAPIFGSVDVADFEVVEGLPDESSWIGTILALVISAQDPMVSGRLIVVPDQELLVLTGDVDSKPIRNLLNKEVSEAGESIGFDTNAAVRVPEVPPATVPPTEEEVEALQVDLDALLKDKIVEFEINSDVITDAGVILLDEILDILRLAPEIRIEVAGHADTQGSPAANLILSEARAASVSSYLITKGENPDRYVVVGYGDARPVADNSTDAGRARNRRIEFWAILEESG